MTVLKNISKPLLAMKSCTELLEEYARHCVLKIRED